jgi:hypothetical protein
MAWCSLGQVGGRAAARARLPWDRREAGGGGEGAGPGYLPALPAGSRRAATQPLSGASHTAAPA